MDDDSAILGLAESFSEFDRARDGDQDGIISHQDLDEMLDSENRFLAGIARYYLNNSSAWQRVDISSGGQAVTDADGLVSVADVRELAGQLESSFRQFAGGQVVRVPIPDGYLTGLLEQYDYDEPEFGFKSVVGPTIEMISDSVNLVTDFVVDQVSMVDVPLLNGNGLAIQASVCVIVCGRATVGWDGGPHADFERGIGVAAMGSLGVVPWNAPETDPDDAGAHYELFVTGGAGLSATYSWVWGREEKIQDGGGGFGLGGGPGFKFGGGFVRWDEVNR